MTNSPHVRSELAYASLGIVPPMICNALLEEPDFRDEYGIEAKAILSFDESNVSIPRFELFKAIREILAGASVKEVADTNDEKWKVEDVSEDGELPDIGLSRGAQRLNLPGYAVLSPDTDTRLRSLDESASDVNLPSGERAAWRDVLAERPLDDDEVDAFHNDLRDTPIERERSIRREMMAGHSSVNSLVPLSRRYYERLVGAYDGSSSIHEYAAGDGREFLDHLLAWRPYDGLLFYLYLASHPSMTAEIDVDRLAREDLARAFYFLNKQGDRTSQIGAVELGLRILPSRPEIEPALVGLIEQIRDDDDDGQASDFKLLSALFLLVDGELSRARLMPAEPPFFRRLTALSQAALIHRQLVNSAIDVDAFYEWAFEQRGEQFYLQSVADLRLEPHWRPGLATASQMRAGSLGRIIIAAVNNEQNIKGGKLDDLILGAESGILQSLNDSFSLYLPGPLEGTESSRSMLPASIVAAIETQLGADVVAPSSFIALVNSALIFRVDAGHADLAAEALKRGNYRLADVEDKAELLTILNGLATVAVVARSCTLASELRILVRRYMRDAQHSLSIEEAARICLVASASHTGVNEWRDFAGEWLTELALGDLDADAGVMLHSHLRCICNAIPELWVSCGRADAALMAYNAMPHPK